ncbi:hypothetical protein F5882DRAFT_423609 [Hyaloscypha sp. PMI_1271]|nr:hypothetical protein F5882DRAFT_423609 [Hyaloscypha sp. PMI_1271]
MGTSKQRVPTYHVVPHFNFAAKGGALQLGSVYKDLLELAPMNKKAEHRIVVPEDDIYPPTTQDGFDATRSKLLTGDFGVWAKALGLSGVGGSASAGGEKSVYESVSCTSVVTCYFDPDDDYVSKCLAAKPISDYMIGSGKKRAPVYLLTGLKVAKKLKFHTEESRKAHAKLEASGTVPQAPVEIGGNTNMANENAKALNFETNDVVVGFRVAKYRLPKPSLFGKKKDKDKKKDDDKKEDEDKKPVGGLYIEGAEMLDDQEGDTKEQLRRFEKVEIPEELKAQAALKEQDENLEIMECWVDPITDIQSV